MLFRRLLPLLLLLPLQHGCIDTELHSVKNQPNDTRTDSRSIDSATVETDGTDDTVDTSPPLAQPIANCSVNPAEVEAIHESANWIGGSSYDPDGSIVEYRWSLVSAPAGSSAIMPSGGSDRLNFSPDVAGDYVGELIVVDNDNIESEPCDATLSATAGDGLWVEMFWVHGGDDMDLHLVNGSGSLTSNSDCYYANCTGGLNWGAAGPDDNPKLDLDDITGAGPENININSPANGSYTVYVHDYPGSVYSGRNDVTVNVYVGGALTWTDTRNINSEGCYEPFVKITIPGGSTTSMTGAC